jgi:rhamnulokinase
MGAMGASVSFLAVDLGASSGRVMDCRWDGARFNLIETHRFPNGGVRLGSDLHWDVLRLWTEIQNGLLKWKAAQNAVPAGIGVDAWGVDFCLLDARDRLLGNPYHYRDSRTKGLPESVSGRMNGRELFDATGVQTMEINTSFQLASLAADGQLGNAHALLMIPDFFQFLLSGAKRAEYTEATTTQLYDLRGRRWSRGTLEKLGLPERIFQEVTMPGETLGTLRASVQADLGFASAFPCIAVASHDTASAVAAIPGLDEASVFLSSGTWSLMGVALDEANVTDAAFAGGFTNEGSADGRALLMKNLTGLWILQECLRAWDAAGSPLSWAELEAASLRAAPFRSFIDTSAGEFLSPRDMPAAVRSFCAASGQPVPQTPGEVARCVFESLSFAYRAVVESLERITGRALTTIRIVGGGCLNRFLCQMTADACSRRVVAGPVEAAALGNALVQAVATGHFASLHEAQSALRASIEPAEYLPAATGAWSGAYLSYNKVIGRLRSSPSDAPANSLTC